MQIQLFENGDWKGERMEKGKGKRGGESKGSRKSI